MSDAPEKKFFVAFIPRNVPDDEGVLEDAVVASDFVLAKLSAEKMMSEDDNVDEVVVGEITISDVAVRSVVRWTKQKKGEPKT